MRPGREQALEAVRTLIAYIGDDPDRDGLIDTPRRVLDGWQEWGAGYNKRPDIRMFDNRSYNEMVVVNNIRFFSTCEHHMAPFYGEASVAYIPGPGVAGLSKIARIVDYHARRLQTQERLTCDVADDFVVHMSAHVGVILRATHLCMLTRGVNQPITRTITSALRGKFMTHPNVRKEFLTLAKDT